MKTLKRILKGACISLAILYMILLALLYTYQRDLIFPGQATQGSPEAQVSPGTGEELVRLRVGGTRVAGLFGRELNAGGTRDPNAADRPTVIFFVGNGSCIAGSLDIVESIRRFSNVMVIDYPGYGMSGGHASEAGAEAAADSAFDYVAARPDCDRRRIVAAGWSLGSSVATYLGSTRPVAGLALWSPFTSMADMSSRQYPIFPSPVIRLLLKFPFPTIREIARVTVPVFIAHGSRDNFVPTSMSRRLIATAAGPVTWAPVAGAGHNDIFGVGGNDLMDRFGKWLASLPPR